MFSNWINAHLISILWHAITGYSLSHEPLSRVATHQLIFQQLYADLEIALQVTNEAKKVALTEKAT